MGFFENVGSKVGGFFKNVASSTVGKTILGAAATAVGGPAAGAAVVAAAGMLGEKKVGEMAAKVISDGVVKTDKVQSTLSNSGINPSANNVQTVVDALKNSASGIANKSIGVASGFTGSVSSDSSTTANYSFMDKVKNVYYSVVNWVINHKKPVLIVGGLVIVACVYYFGFGKKKKWRV